MQTKSIATSAPGNSLETKDWKLRVLRELRVGEPCVFPAVAFGVGPMAELARCRIFIRGFPPDDSDLIGLDIDGEVIEFSVHRVRGMFCCEEVREANPRILHLSEDEITMYELDRSRFYQSMATDLGLSGHCDELTLGIWEIGRKRLPGKDASKVLFVERGTSAEAVRLVVITDSFRAFCLLGAGALASHGWHPGKTLTSAAVEVRDGRFSSEVFEDLAASQIDQSVNTCVDLERSPPMLYVRGLSFELPVAFDGRPSDGGRYLSYLFDHPETDVSCWDLYAAIRGEQMGKVGGPSWSDEVLDKKAKSELISKLRDAMREVAEAELDETIPQAELERMRSNLQALQDQSAKILDVSGKSRQIVEGDRGKARQRVRKALGVVIDRVSRQNHAIGSDLKKALGSGDPVSFVPPPEWGL